MCPKITQEEIVILKNYKYQSTPPTPLDKLLTPFWKYCTELLPMWMAPNLVTFIGFIFALLGNIVMVMASNDMNSTIPAWALFFNAFCVFVYQTFDSMDGKQARRTNSSSILGQLFDHGCDSFLTPFYAVNLMQVLKKGSDIWSLTWVIALLYYYFVMTWEEYNIEILPTGTGLFGSTESIYLIIVISLIGAIFGQESTTAPFINAEWAKVIHFSIEGLFILASFLTCYTFTMQAVLHIEERHQKVTAKIDAFLPFILFSASLFCVCNTEFFRANGAVILSIYAFDYFLINARMFLVSHMKKDVNIYQWESAAVFLPALFHLLKCFGIVFMTEWQVYAIVCFLLFTSSIQFSYSVIVQLCKGLDIHCFSLKQIKTQ